MDGKSPAEAAVLIPLVFAPQGAADSSNRLLMQYLMLGRCPGERGFDYVPDI
jgi:hypothetical protein